MMACHPRLFAAVLLLAPFAACDAPPESPPALEQTRDRGPIAATLTIAPPSITIGDQLVATLTVRGPDPLNVNFPDPNAFSPSWDATADPTTTTPTTDNTNLVVTRRQYTVYATAAGEPVVPPLTLDFDAGSDPNRSPFEITFDAVPVSVMSTLEPNTPLDALAPILGVRTAPPAPWPWYVWVALAGALAGVVGLAAWLVRHLMKPAPPPPPIPAETWARRQLDALAHERLWERRAFREHFYRLSEIFRGYLTRAFATPARDMTTEELLAELRRRPRWAERCDPQQLHALLTAGDRVKYAAREPTVDEAQQSLDEVRVFIERMHRDATSSEWAAA